MHPGSFRVEFLQTSCISIPFKDMLKQNVLSSDEKKSLKTATCQKLALSLLCLSIIYSLGTYI